MRKVLCMAALLFAGSMLVASDKPQQGNYVQGTVISVERQEVSSPGTCCSNPTDTPLQTQSYAFNVAVRVGCGTYVGEYDSPFDYLPAAFAPNHPIDVRLTKHILYFNVSGHPEMKMGIVQKKVDSASCTTSTASR